MAKTDVKAGARHRAAEVGGTLRGKARTAIGKARGAKEPVSRLTAPRVLGCSSRATTGEKREARGCGRGIAADTAAPRGGRSVGPPRSPVGCLRPARTLLRGGAAPAAG